MQKIFKWQTNPHLLCSATGITAICYTLTESIMVSDIAESLETALEQFGGIQEDLEKQINIPMSVKIV
jgi:hypothetical protein